MRRYSVFSAFQLLNTSEDVGSSSVCICVCKKGGQMTWLMDTLLYTLLFSSVMFILSYTCYNLESRLLCHLVNQFLRPLGIVYTHTVNVELKGSPLGFIQLMVRYRAGVPWISFLCVRMHVWNHNMCVFLMKHPDYRVFYLKQNSLSSYCIKCQHCSETYFHL